MKNRLNFEKVIYLSHPYGGIEENKNKIESISLKLMKKYPEYLFLSAVHAFGHLYHVTDYDTGLSYCLWLLQHCDEMWIISENWQSSKGCVGEVDYCKEHKIPYKLYGEL